MIFCPEKIVRFYGNTDYALETIALKQVTYINANRLNDPFDPWLGFITDFDDNYLKLASWIKKNRSHKLKLFKEKMPENFFKEMLQETRERSEKVRNEIFVFSTCEASDQSHPKDNLYMWAHYANGHRGVAIEFDSKLWNEKLHVENKTDIKKEEYFMKTIYQDDTFKITFEDFYELAIKGSDKLIRKKLEGGHKIKSTVWKNEKEWRLINHEDKSKLEFIREALPENVIKSIYLGCRTDANISEKIIFETKKNYPNTKIYQAQQIKDKFALDFKLVK